MESFAETDNNQHETIPIPDIGSYRGNVELPAFRPQVNVFQDYSIGRSSPIWSVGEAALRLSKREEHLERLSQPRKLHPEYRPAKQALPVITKAAKEAIPSERLEELARATSRASTKEAEWTVKRSALNYNPSDRILDLSRPKCLPVGYRPCKTNTEMWQVCPSARKAVISERIGELSKPVMRTVATNLPRNDAFVVSIAARKANASDRIIELSRPIKRPF